jgi:hypothetical protein
LPSSWLLVFKNHPNAASCTREYRDQQKDECYYGNEPVNADDWHWQGTPTQVERKKEKPSERRDHKNAQRDAGRLRGAWSNGNDR